ncbi:2143_t:CDS:1, partial [Scutellospora calospora]
DRTIEWPSIDDFQYHQQLQQNGATLPPTPVMPTYQSYQQFQQRYYSSIPPSSYYFGHSQQYMFPAHL